MAVGASLYFEIDLITAAGINLTVNVLLDTSFTGFVAINKQDLDGLDWAFIRREELRTAQGETTFDIYLGKVLLNGQELEIPVFAREEITEILLGSQWLMNLPLVVNFREGLLTLGE